ncbi:hypothetical protein [Pleionea sediminis]|uniref:hypothetical protein n=1 Tax=Pleionea sediminis TaxID=2569479 RepID=UPI001184F5A9|nr:hypothetical protein [Pleionea sediminis]
MRFIIVSLMIVLLTGCYTITQSEAVISSTIRNNATAIPIKTPKYSFFGKYKEQAFGPFFVTNMKVRSKDRDHDHVDLGDLYQYEKSEYSQKFSFNLAYDLDSSTDSWRVRCIHYDYFKAVRVTIVTTDHSRKAGLDCSITHEIHGAYSLRYRAPNRFEVFSDKFSSDSKALINVRPRYEIKEHLENESEVLIKTSMTSDITGYEFLDSNLNYVAGLTMVGEPTLWLMDGNSTGMNGLAAAISYTLNLYSIKRS